MFFMLKRCDLISVRKKLAVLYLLNVTDIIFTLLLTSTGLFIEINGVMKRIIENPFLIFTVKILLPLLLLGFVYKRIGKANYKQLHHSNVIINLCLIAYTLINTSHIFFTFLLFIE